MVQIKKYFSRLATRLSVSAGALVLVFGLSACKVQVGGSSGYSRYPSYGGGWNNSQHHHNNNNHYYGDRQQQRPRPRPNRPTDTRPNRPDRPNRPNRPPQGNRPNRPRPERNEQRNEQAQLSQKVQLAALKLKKVSLYKNDTQVAFVRSAQSGEVQMQLKYIDAKSKKNVAVAYNLKDLQLDNAKNPEKIKVGFCAGQECADNEKSVNAWNLVVDLKSKQSLLENNQGKGIYLDGQDAQRVLGVTDQLLSEMQEHAI